MSLTTASSLQNRKRDFPRTWNCCRCCRRKIAPSSPQPDNADFISLGRKGKRVICVFHLDPFIQGCLDPLPVRKLELDEKDGYQSDSSDKEYWFTKWSKPLRTVRRYQVEQLKQLDVAKDQTKQSAADAELKAVCTFAAIQSSEIVQEASQEASSIRLQHQDVGVVNPAFVESSTDPEATSPAIREIAPTTSLSTNIKPLLYFIHGAGGSSESSWSRLMHYFASLDYEVLSLDLLGHGYSNTPQLQRCYTFKRLLGDVINVFDAHVSNGRKCVLIGHGYGCSLAVALSRQRSANISLIALLSCGGPTPLAPPVTWRREWKLPASILRCFRNFLPCGVRRNVFYGPRGKSCLHETVNFQSLPGYVRHHLAIGQSWPEGDVAFHRKVAVPTLLVHGLKDKFVSLVEMCEMERTIPRAFLEVIPEAGHDLMTEAPDQLCKMLRKFFEHWQR